MGRNDFNCAHTAIVCKYFLVIMSLSEVATQLFLASYQILLELRVYTSSMSVDTLEKRST